MRHHLIAGLLALFGVALAANASVYTSLEPARCVRQKGGPDWFQDRCAGVGGLALEVSEGDLRQNVVVVRGGRRTSLELWGVVGSAFSTVGPRAEWRLSRGVPEALILRYTLYTDADPKRGTSNLVVARLRPTPCVVAILPPSAQQNARARLAADTAPNKPCLKAPGGQ